MKTYLTEIKAICPIDGELKTFDGGNVEAICLSHAEHKLQMTGRGYCKIIGELIMEIGCKKGSYEPDFNNVIDYENNLN